MPPVKFGFGQAVTRKEDDALIRGVGRYVADVQPDGVLHAVVLRSPHAHAKFKITDVEAAKAVKGVRLILTAADLKDLGDLPCHGIPPGVKVDVPSYPILATDTVRHVGDSVALIVADTIDQARDGAEKIEVEYEQLPHIVDMEAAVKSGAPAVWKNQKDNVCFETTIGDKKKTDALFEKADKVIELRIVNPRVVTNYLDTRGVIAEYEKESGRLNITLSSQGPHVMRDVLAGDVLKIAPEKLRVMTPDVGGGFGTKLFPYREYALVTEAARRLKKSVKWIGERTEHFLSCAQGRDNITIAKVACDSKGKFLAFSVDTLADMGAYLSLYAPFIPFIGAEMLPGLYDFKACHIRLRGVYTNTVPVDAYRGAGRPEAAYVIERVVDHVARELGIPRDTLRKRNFIAAKQMPYTTPTNKTYDSGEFAQHMEKAQDIADWKGFEKRAKAAKKNGKLRGIGLGSYIEACGGNGPESAKMQLDQDGGVTIFIGTQSSGQGHHTAYAQIVADHLGLSPDMVRTVQGDTDKIATGAGTGGSSSIPVGGVAVGGAAKKLGENLKIIAADKLEAGVGDLEIAEGNVRVVGTDRQVSFADIAKAPVKPELLITDDKCEPPAATYPNGTHVVEVEIDPGTGHVDFVNYVIVDDFGVTLNPLMLAGQIHGGTVQGLGQALLEHAIYDKDSGQLVTASLMDYALPRASHVPPMSFETNNVKCVTNALGVKGAGEAGAIGSCPAIMNAIADALYRAHGTPQIIDMPATPQRVWQALRESERAHTM
ncbi:carbon monoxide dehydrogenase large chain [Variibacter gotjawalensis]|uniref:Carbon monoxide dehydrogenase large chain n=1 Tax=Variibacter gotjawalensis TaxID=1333996 RepID=A0A0S3PUY0_9BRAD|nr:xanthine dehydrogenase family protein molybdopterin-binding subunit [Variibacter gotjawalensis]NIK49994.1 carbon-monoxide dehydrogenase large subunit [Variibacter gotjawalensis]RZS45993.1 xanthine dehydrogenase molybdenum binding subunit apoprotein [Variibacter gotjawalensis]BAT59668.1 carbon monoxide dehydrogenase large chain [Variibacter gotjawalensis]